MTQAANYYSRLGLTSAATSADIRQAYRELSKQYHPDTTHLPPELARERFQLICEAYRVLSDPNLRQQYDRYQQIAARLASQAAALSSPSPEAKKVSYTSSAYLDPNDRPLSAGEIFALFILVLTFLGCMMLAVVLGLMRGTIILMPPS